MSMLNFSNLCNGKYFVIPRNQRGYSWESRHVDSIFEDIALADQQSHYMGSIILNRTDSADFQDDSFSTVAEFTIEDGQQRVTSFFIILKCLADAMDKHEGVDASEVNEIRKMIYLERHGIKNPRVKNENEELNDSLKYVFGLTSNNSAEAPPAKAMQEVEKHLQKKFSEFSSCDLKVWKNKLVNQAKFTMIDLRSEGINRYLAFDAINSRGLPLSEFDKIKNFCILVDQTVGVESNPEGRWYEAISKLEHYGVSRRSQEASFISECFNTMHNRKVSQDQVHDEFVLKHKPLLKKDKSPHDIEISKFQSFISTWPEYAESFAFITSYKKSRYYGEKCSQLAGQWLDRIENLDLISITRPVLTAAHIKYDSTNFQQVVRACEIYLFRMHAVSRYRKDKNSSGLISLANDILVNDKPAEEVCQTIAEWLNDMSPFKDLVEYLFDPSPKYYYDKDVKGWPHVYYFLYEYEIYCSPKGTPAVNWKSQDGGKINSIEHILPQNHRDGGAWQAAWTSESDADRFKHRLGNLVLTADNSKLGRRGFSDKVKMYSGLKATNSEKKVKDFSDEGEWTKRSILEREEHMMQFVAKRWTLPSVSDAEEIVLPEDFSRESGERKIFQCSFDQYVDQAKILDEEYDKD